MLGLKLNHVSKRGPGSNLSWNFILKQRLSQYHSRFRPMYSYFYSRLIAFWYLICSFIYSFIDLSIPFVSVWNRQRSIWFEGTVHWMVFTFDDVFVVSVHWAHTSIMFPIISGMRRLYIISRSYHQREYRSINTTQTGPVAFYAFSNSQLLWQYY